SVFGCDVGLSDHTPGIGVAIAGATFGATVIEKHVTLARADGGVDAAFSLEPQELAQLVQESAAAREAIGQVHFGPTSVERDSLLFRRSLYVCQDLDAGETLTSSNLRAIRPGLGLPPGDLGRLLGKRVNRAVKRGTPMSWELLA